MIGLLCALEGELERIKNEMSVDKEDIWGGRTFYFGSLAGREVVAVKTGVGKVFFSHDYTTAY